MTMGGGPRSARRGLGVLGTALLAGIVAACGSSPGAASPSLPSSAPTDDSDANPPPASEIVPSPGAWSGTITFHAVMNVVKDDTSTSGQGTYQDTLTTHATTQVDATDVFTVSGQDPADLSLGISDVKLLGLVANHGTALERYVFDTDKHNALGCHYTNEIGSEVSGSWTVDSHGGGSITFQDDGSYIIDMGESGDPATGEEPPTPQLPKRLWETDTIIDGAAKDCPTSPGDVKTTEAPVILWASGIVGAYDQITGKLDVGSPGSVLDGSASFKETSPDATLTVTWHLVHDGPLTLPHN